MDEQLIAQKLESLRHCNADTTSPRTMGQTFEALAVAGVIDIPLSERMRKSVGFRNVMVHNYDEVNWQIVFSICKYHLEDFRNFARIFSEQINQA